MNQEDRLQQFVQNDRVVRITAPPQTEQPGSALEAHVPVTEYEHINAGHIRCGGGWLVRRKRIGGD